MYYHVREPYSGTHNNEGFAKEMNLKSELMEGQICIDGQAKYDIGCGGSVFIDYKPEYRLKCIKFIV